MSKSDYPAFDSCRILFADVIGEADGHPGKWYELFGKHPDGSTQTYGQADTFDELRPEYERLAAELGPDSIYIDIWEEVDGIPEIRFGFPTRKNADKSLKG